MLSLIISIIALGAIVAFHEFGHFIVARLFGVGVIEFSVGMGPRVLTAVRNNTRYSLRALPFGGSCMMLGEEMDEGLYGNEDPDVEEERDPADEEDEAPGAVHDGVRGAEASGGGSANDDDDRSAKAGGDGGVYGDDRSAEALINRSSDDRLNRESGTEYRKTAFLWSREEAHRGGHDAAGPFGSEETHAETIRMRNITNGAFESELHEAAGDEIRVDGRLFKRSEQFVEKPAWQRFLIIAAGPFFNFILAFLMALIITSTYGYDRPVIAEVREGTPLFETGIRAGDRITGLAVLGDRTRAVHLTTVDTARDIMLFMYEKSSSMQAQETFVIRYKDAETGLTEDAVAAPFYDEEAGVYRLGFSYSTAYMSADGIADIILYSLYDVKYCIKSAILSIKLLITGSVSNSDVMGPVRMVATMDEAVDEAADYGVVTAVMTLLNLMILISGSLGAANLLPIPALDGGRLVFIIIEMVIRRPVPREFEWRVHMAGMLFLLGLMVLILFNDVLLLVVG